MGRQSTDRPSSEDASEYGNPDLDPPDNIQRERERRRGELRLEREATARVRERRLQELHRQREIGAQYGIDQPPAETTIPPTAVDDDAQLSEESFPPPTHPAPMPSAAKRRRNWSGLLLFFLVLALLGFMALLGILAYALWGPPGWVSTPEATEPTPDLNATVVVAVVSAVSPLRATPPTPDEAPPEEEATNTGTTPVVAQPTLESPTNHNRLEEIECGAHCLTEGRLPIGHVEWVRQPKVSTRGILSFRAVIDTEANFTIPGHRQCGFPNVSFTDDSNALYGFIISRGTAVECPRQPGEWISNQYYYGLNILTVSAQIDPVAARHPGLSLCLWTSGANAERNRLIDCVPVLQP